MPSFGGGKLWVLHEGVEPSPHWVRARDATVTPMKQVMGYPPSCGCVRVLISRPNQANHETLGIVPNVAIPNFRFGVWSRTPPIAVVR